MVGFRQDYGSWYPAKDCSVVALTGTFEFTNADATVDGTGTECLSELQEGDLILDLTDNFGGYVSSVAADDGVDAVTLKANYAGTGGAAHSCVRIRNSADGEVELPYRHEYTLPALGAPQKIDLSAWKDSDDGYALTVLYLYCSKASRAVWVKHDSSTSEQYVASALVTSDYNEGEKCIYIPASTWMELPIEQALNDGYSLYICSGSTAGTFSFMGRHY